MTPLKSIRARTQTAEAENLRSRANVLTMAKCKAHGRTSKKPCNNPPVTGRAVCRMHGGATPRGTESPHFKHGLYSRYASKELADRIDELRQDEERLHDLREVLALQGALLGEALAQNELTAAVAISETVSRSIDRYHKHNPPVPPPQLSGQAARDKVKGLLDQADKLLELKEIVGGK